LGVRGILHDRVMLGVLVSGGLLGILLSGRRLLDGGLGVLRGSGVAAGVRVQLRTHPIAATPIVVTHVLHQHSDPVDLTAGASGRLVRGLVHRVLCIQIVIVGRGGPRIVSVRGGAQVPADLHSIDRRRIQYVVEGEGCAVVRAIRGYRFVVVLRRIRV